jgi:hypothetical protein
MEKGAGSPRTFKVRGAPPLPSLVVSHAAPGVVGGRPEWRGEACRRRACCCGTVCAPRHRVVRGCICCAPACLLFRKTDVVQRRQPGANNSASDAPPLGRSMPVFACSSMAVLAACVRAGQRQRQASQIKRHKSF